MNMAHRDVDRDERVVEGNEQKFFSHKLYRKNSTKVANRLQLLTLTDYLHEKRFLLYSLAIA